MTITELMIVNPKISIAVFSVFITLVSTLVQKKFTDQEHLKALKKRQKELQVELRKTKEPSVLQELNAEMLQLTGLMFKSSMKPMFVTLIPFLLLVAWFRSIFVPVMGNGWIWYYLGFSIVSSMIFRKVLKVS